MNNIKKVMNWRIIGLIFVIALFYLFYTLAGTTNTLYVNGVKIAKTEGQPVERTETIYVPVEPIVKGMGDKLTWIDKPYSALITKKDGTKINIYVTRSTATVNGKSVPISTKVIETVTVPVPMKPAQISGKLYVPVEFLKEVMGYIVSTKKEGSTEFVVVGKAPAGGLEPNEETPTTPTPTPAPTPTPTPSETWKPDLGYLPPAGWTPPTIKSTSTDDFQKDRVILEDELGFTKGYMYNPYGKDATAGTRVRIHDHPEYYVSIDITAWYGSKTSEHIDNKIPYVVRELMKFYMPTQSSTVFNVLKDGYNGKDVSKYMNKTMTLDGREVKMMENETSITVMIGHKK